MDPRYRRSREALRSAALELASQRSIADISAAELCRVAGVTRETFYRHTTSPLALLADALADEIAEVTTEWQGPEGELESNAGFRLAERELLQHVAARAPIYRLASRPHLLAPLRANLESILRETLIDYLHRHPIAVPVGIEPGDESALRLVACYASSGTVGAIESWLLDEPLDVERGVSLILAASPAFWFAPDDRQQAPT